MTFFSLPTNKCKNEDDFIIIILICKWILPLVKILCLVLSVNGLLSSPSYSPHSFEGHHSNDEGYGQSRSDEPQPVNTIEMQRMADLSL